MFLRECSGIFHSFIISQEKQSEIQFYFESDNTLQINYYTIFLKEQGNFKSKIPRRQW